MELDEVVRGRYRSRSYAIAEAIRKLLRELRWEWRGEVVCLVTYFYDREKSSEELRELGHQYLDIVLSTLHVHASERVCVEVVALKGDALKIREYIESLRLIRGVKQVTLSIIPLSSVASV